MTIKKAAPSQRKPKFLPKDPVKKGVRAEADREKAEALIKQIGIAKSTIATAQAIVADAEADLLPIMERLGETKHEVKDGKSLVTATVVRGARAVLDEGMLQKNLGSTLWNKVTTRVLDRKKLEAYVASNEVDPMVVARATSEVPNKPYVKITRK